MLSFEGYLDRVERLGQVVRARIVAGGFDPSPETPPVLLLSVESPADQSLYQTLLQVQERDSGCHVLLVSGTEAQLTTDHGNEIAIRGKKVVAEEAEFDAQDFERLAKQNHEWGQSQWRALREHCAQLERMKALAQDQRSRILVKMQGHSPGSTAHTLYEQQLAFLSRLLDGEV